MDKLEEFLKELLALTNKYKIEVYGCGCCPILTDMDTGKNIATGLSLDNGKYEIWG